MERYDPATDTWTMVANLSVGRDAIGVCVLGEKLFAVGGYDGSAYLSLVEAYDSRCLLWPDILASKISTRLVLRENCWREVASLNTGRGGACVVVVQK
jgi:kelch-like protein 1/4/5